MEAYSSFAKVYDEFMENTDYDGWSDFIKELLSEHGINDGLICELGCGTGQMCERLDSFGFDMIGIDMSSDMLSVAMESRGERDILYLLQDMREFELYGTVKAIISCCDSINYVTEPDELIETFKLCNNYLEKDGILFFDFNTDKKYESIGECTIAENGEKGSFIWENTYYEDEKINEYELTLFIEGEDGRYDKSTENHYQRAYSLPEMQQILEAAGFEILKVCDDYTKAVANENTARACIAARVLPGRKLGNI